MQGVLDKIVAEPFRDLFQRMVEFLPNLLSSIIVLGIGLIIAWAVKALLQKLLQIFNIDNVCKRVGLTDILQKGGFKGSPSDLICKSIYGIVLLIFVIMALYSLKIDAIENLIEKFFLYLPNIFVAVILIVIGYVLGTFFSRAVLIAAVNRGFKHSGILYTTVKASILVLTITMALEQLGIGKDTVIIAFSIIFGGAVFAVSLAFGLAGKELAQQFLEKRLKQDSEPEEPEDEIKHL